MTPDALAGPKVGGLALGPIGMKLEKRSLDLTERTIEFWSRYTGESITTEDAREIIENMTGFFKTLQQWDKQAKENSGKDSEL
jgi:hypothetical protein